MFTFHGLQNGDKVRAVMTNARFPGLTLRTGEVTITTQVSTSIVVTNLNDRVFTQNAVIVSSQLSQ